MTMEELDELEQAAKAATFAPWKVHELPLNGRVILGPNDVEITPTDNDGCYSDPQSDYVNLADEDAKLIVLLRNNAEPLIAASRENAALRERVKELSETVAKLERMHTDGICTYEHNGKGWTTQPQEGEFGSVRFYDDHIRHCAKWLSEMPGGMKRWLKEYERTNPPE